MRSLSCPRLSADSHPPDDDRQAAGAGRDFPFGAAYCYGKVLEFIRRGQDLEVAGRIADDCRGGRMGMDVSVGDTFVVDVHEPSVDPAGNAGLGNERLKDGRSRGLFEAQRHGDPDQEPEPLPDGSGVLLGTELAGGNYRVLAVAFHGQEQLLHVVQLFGAMAFHRHPQFEVQDRTIATRPSHAVERDGMDGDRSVRGGNDGVWGTVVEPYALGSDGVGKYPQ